MNTKQIGNVYENIACEYLVGLNYKILNRNWTCRWGEIDIIAKDLDTLVFVEVKYRSSKFKGYPHESVDLNKRHKLYRAINFYIKSDHGSSLKDTPLRIDAICFMNNKKSLDIQHYKNLDIH